MEDWGLGIECGCGRPGAKPPYEYLVSNPCGSVQEEQSG